MKIKNLVSIVVASFSIKVYGQVFDITSGIGSWMPASNGKMQYERSDAATTIDLTKNNLKTTANKYIFIDFKHMIPIIPNMKIEKYHFSTSGNTKSDSQVVFGNAKIENGEELKTNLNLTQNDFIFYWAIPGLNLFSSGVFGIDFGINIKQFQGTNIEITNTTTAFDKTNIDSLVPMAYVNTSANIPFIPLTLSASFKKTDYKNSKLTEQTATITYKLANIASFVELYLNAGYKKQNLVLSEKLLDNVNIDTSLSGMFFGINAKF